MSIRKLGLSIAALAFVLVLVPAAANAQGVLFVKNNKVGIGVSDPISPLHIKQDGGGSLIDMVRLVNNGAPQFRYVDTSTGTQWRIGPNPFGDFVMNETADLTVAEMRVTKNGSVYVNGTLTHPDYVFEPGYRLMPISELAAFVGENKHLPNVLSSAERKKQGGIDLSAFPLQLLEKIEELALYTIQQQQTLDGLLAENAELREKLDSLERAVTR